MKYRIQITEYTPNLRLQAEAMSENALAKNLVTTYSVFGWESYHTHIAKRSQAGWPDEFAIQADWRRSVWAELKREAVAADKSQGIRATKPTITRSQMHWLDLLSLQHDEVYLFMPRDWLTGAIDECFGSALGHATVQSCRWKYRQHRLEELGIRVVPFTANVSDLKEGLQTPIREIKGGPQVSKRGSTGQ